MEHIPSRNFLVRRRYRKAEACSRFDISEGPCGPLIATGLGSPWSSFYTTYEYIEYEVLFDVAPRTYEIFSHHWFRGRGTMFQYRGC